MSGPPPPPSGPPKGSGDGVKPAIWTPSGQVPVTTRETTRRTQRESTRQEIFRKLTHDYRREPGGLDPNDVSMTLEEETNRLFPEATDAKTYRRKIVEVLQKINGHKNLNVRRHLMAGTLDANTLITSKDSDLSRWRSEPPPTGSALRERGESTLSPKAPLQTTMTSTQPGASSGGGTPESPTVSQGNGTPSTAANMIPPTHLRPRADGVQSHSTVIQPPDKAANPRVSLPESESMPTSPQINMAKRDSITMKSVGIMSPSKAPFPVPAPPTNPHAHRLSISSPSIRDALAGSGFGGVGPLLASAGAVPGGRIDESDPETQADRKVSTPPPPSYPAAFHNQHQQYQQQQQPYGFATTEKSVSAGSSPLPKSDDRDEYTDEEGGAGGAVYHPDLQPDMVPDQAPSRSQPTPPSSTQQEDKSEGEEEPSPPPPLSPTPSPAQHYRGRDTDTDRDRGTLGSPEAPATRDGGDQLGDEAVEDAIVAREGLGAMRPRGEADERYEHHQEVARAFQNFWRWAADELSRRGANDSDGVEGPKTLEEQIEEARHAIAHKKDALKCMLTQLHSLRGASSSIDEAEMDRDTRPGSDMDKIKQAAGLEILQMRLRMNALVSRVEELAHGRQEDSDNADIVENHRRIKRLEDELNTMHQQMAEKEREVRVLSEELKRLRETERGEMSPSRDPAHNQALIDDQQKQIRDLRELVQSITRSSKEEVDHLSDEIKRLMSECAPLRERRDHLEGRCAQLEAQLEQARDDAHQARIQMREREQQIETLKMENARLVTSLSEGTVDEGTRTELACLEGAKRALEEQLQDKEATIRELESERGRLTEGMASLEKQLATQQELINSTPTLMEACTSPLSSQSPLMQPDQPPRPSSPTYENERLLAMGRIERLQAMLLEKEERYGELLLQLRAAEEREQALMDQMDKMGQEMSGIASAGGMLATLDEDLTAVEGFAPDQQMNAQLADAKREASDVQQQLMRLTQLLSDRDTEIGRLNNALSDRATPHPATATAAAPSPKHDITAAPPPAAAAPAAAAAATPAAAPYSTFALRQPDVSPPGQTSPDVSRPVPALSMPSPAAGGLDTVMDHAKAAMVSVPPPQQQHQQQQQQQQAPIVPPQAPPSPPAKGVEGLFDDSGERGVDLFGPEVTQRSAHDDRMTMTAVNPPLQLSSPPARPGGVEALFAERSVEEAFPVPPPVQQQVQQAAAAPFLVEQQGGSPVLSTTTTPAAITVTSPEVAAQRQQEPAAETAEQKRATVSDFFEPEGERGGGANGWIDIEPDEFEGYPQGGHLAISQGALKSESSSPPVNFTMSRPTLSGLSPPLPPSEVTGEEREPEGGRGQGGPGMTLAVEETRAEEREVAAPAVVTPPPLPPAIAQMSPDRTVGDLFGGPPPDHGKAIGAPGDEVPVTAMAPQPSLPLLNGTTGVEGGHPEQTGQGERERAKVDDLFGMEAGGEDMEASGWDVGHDEFALPATDKPASPAKDIVRGAGEEEEGPRSPIPNNLFGDNTGGVSDWLQELESGGKGSAAANNDEEDWMHGGGVGGGWDFNIGTTFGNDLQQHQQQQDQPMAASPVLSPPPPAQPTATTMATMWGQHPQPSAAIPAPAPVTHAAVPQPTSDMDFFASMGLVNGEDSRPASSHPSPQTVPWGAPMTASTGSEKGSGGKKDLGSLFG